MVTPMAFSQKPHSGADCGVNLRTLKVHADVEATPKLCGTMVFAGKGA
jgi:hypothetical protein